MAKHKLEIKAECGECGGTGIYCGFGECKGAGVVCRGCGGTGEMTIKLEYSDFEGRKKLTGVRHVFLTNPGIVIGEGLVNTGKYAGRDLKFSDFGGMSYEDWLAGKKFGPGTEMREFTCPAWYYQSADYRKKPDWKECGIGGTFAECSRFCTKEKCWAKWDRTFGKKK